MHFKSISLILLACALPHCTAKDRDNHGMHPMRLDSHGYGGIKLKHFQHGKEEPATDGPSRFIPWKKYENFQNTPLIEVKVGNNLLNGVSIDTGSTGFLIAANKLPGGADAWKNKGKPAYLMYSSSKTFSSGRWVPVNITFPERGGESEMVSEVEVLAVYSQCHCDTFDPKTDGFECPEHKIRKDKNGVPEKLKSGDEIGITYMGIGFGNKNNPSFGPDKNPLLNIKTIGGKPVSMVPGWVITAEGIQVGINRQNTQGFKFQKLRPGVFHREDNRDWLRAQMCLAIGTHKCTTGDLLIDSGIDQAYITLPSNIDYPKQIEDKNRKSGNFGGKEGRLIREGTTVTVIIGTKTVKQSEFSFVIKHEAEQSENPIAPNQMFGEKDKRIAVSRPSKGAENVAYINTGRHLMRKLDICFNTGEGVYGVRWSSVARKIIMYRGEQPQNKRLEPHRILKHVQGISAA